MPAPMRELAQVIKVAHLRLAGAEPEISAVGLLATADARTLTLSIQTGVNEVRELVATGAVHIIENLDEIAEMRWDPRHHQEVDETTLPTALRELGLTGPPALEAVLGAIQLLVDDDTLDVLAAGAVRAVLVLDDPERTREAVEALNTPAAFTEWLSVQDPGEAAAADANANHLTPS
ncbi:hypothetical protein ACQCX5_06015 [Propionibacteriaceae bacterium G57]|uniref:hypothetical protein n=1 Tax=Aestuariimicrobium sp. G57 TaxID=3418485 RepID=UPI003DA6F4EB